MAVRQHGAAAKPKAYHAHPIIADRAPIWHATPDNDIR